MPTKTYKVSADELPRAQELLRRRLVPDQIRSNFSATPRISKPVRFTWPTSSITSFAAGSSGYIVISAQSVSVLGRARDTLATSGVRVSDLEPGEGWVEETARGL